MGFLQSTSDPFGLAETPVISDNRDSGSRASDNDGPGIPPGVSSAVGGALIAGGAPIIEKTGGMGYGYTSILSQAASSCKVRVPFQLPSFVGTTLRWTANPARFASRWAPYVGWVLMASDAYNFCDYLGKQPNRHPDERWPAGTGFPGPDGRPVLR